MYICLKACKEGFVKGCRPLLGINGCHLKGAYPGMCLVAVGKDGNNNIYPVAWAVVEVETVDTWTWFLELLANDVGKIEGEGLTIMSDRMKGIRRALKNAVPKAEIRFCVRHIWANFKLRFNGLLYKDTFWKAARASTKTEFNSEMEAMKFLSKEAWTYLNEIGAEHWSRHAFQTFSKSNMLLNNLCETFNAVLKEARDKPILTHMEWMRIYVMNRLRDKREGADKHTGKHMPYVNKYLKWAADESRFCVVNASDEHAYEVEYKGGRWVVNLKRKTCTCYQWDLSGLPCTHAMGCILKQRMNPDDFVDEVYSKDKYVMAYAPRVSPMPGSNHWEKTGLPEPLPPPHRKMPGRPPAKKRIKEADENQSKHVKRPKRSNKCSNCGQLGHYKRTCNNPGAPSMTNSANGGRPQSNSAWAKEGRMKAAKRMAEKAAYAEQHPTTSSTTTIAPIPTQGSQNMPTWATT